MKIVWDEPKRLSNLERRGLDFAALDIEFFAEAVIFTAKHDRRLAVGKFDGVVIAVVFRWLGTEGISIISMRRANRNERSRL
ncbi:MAG: BrnT family toxin [Devosia sp.]